MCLSLGLIYYLAIDKGLKRWYNPYIGWTIAFEQRNWLINSNYDAGQGKAMLEAVTVERGNDVSYRLVTVEMGTVMVLA